MEGTVESEHNSGMENDSFLGILGVNPLVEGEQASGLLCRHGADARIPPCLLLNCPSRR